MEYELTNEQLAITNAVVNPIDELIVIEAVAGSAKSTTITHAVQQAYSHNPSLKAEYWVFGSANASEAKLAFGHSCMASTIHAKAYHAIVKPYKLRLPVTGFLTWRDIPKSYKLSYNLVNTSISHVEDFCISEYLSINDYSDSLDKPLTGKQLSAVNLILEGLSEGHIRTTHAFYLKLYHILVMNGTITQPELDILILDEAGDCTQIVLDIFDRTLAKQKVILGDTLQSIYGFMGLVSAFDYYRGQGTYLTLSKSFRVNSADALLVQSFCREYLDTTMTFTGMDYLPNQSFESSAYLVRSNATLISHMVHLESANTPFRLSSKAKIEALFLWPLALLYLKPGFTQRKPELKHLQSDADEWGAHSSLRNSSSLRSYIIKHNKSNAAIVSANRLLMQYTPEEIITAYKAAESHITANANLTIQTAHTSKGGTYDTVALSDDINLAVSKVLLTDRAEWTDNDIETLKLAYVASTRHRYVLHNAQFLDKYKPKA